MNNVIRKFNQNRKVIFFVIIIVVFVIIAIQILNNIAKEKNENNKENTIQNISSYEKRTSTITEKTITEKTNNENIEIIDKFISLCNEKKTHEAYLLLSEECKNQKFSTEEDFIKNYYELFFDKEKKYTYQMWINKSGNYTYQIKLYNDDLMSTGGKETSYIEEYYTIVDGTNGYELNINGFIGNNTINKQSTNMNISISVKEKSTFMDYETYIVEIKNNTSNDILIDSKEKTSTMYVQDEEENKYPCYSHEIVQEKLKINAKETRKVKIKYTKKYTSTLEAENLVFSDVILNYNDYIKIDNKESYKNRCEIVVEL